jgi:phosphatidylglycerophosphate synthase
MAGYPEKWQSALPSRQVTPRPLVLEAGLELLTLGTLIAAVAAIGIVPLSWSGLTVAALSYAAVTMLVAAGLGRHAPHHHFGLANALTLCRAALNIVLVAVIAEQLLGEDRLLDHAFRWGLTIAATIAWVLDGVDGWAARRSNMASEFGARFDMETDGVFLLSLSLLLAVGGIVGPWVLASGLIYYVFRLASRIWPVLNAPLIPSLRRKTICAAQGALLIAALAPAMPSWGAQLSCLTGLALLIYSFGVDMVWLLSRPR